jgi:serine/threonine protein kinase
MQDAKRADARSDIYSLGQILFEMYTGEANVALHGLDGLPAGIALIISKCTEARPDRRFEGTTHLRDAFMLIASGQSMTDAADSLKSLVGRMVTERQATAEQISELRRLIAHCQDDPSLLHDIAMQLPEQAIAALFAADSGIGSLLFRRFSEISCGQGWAFEYTDKIGGACLRFARASSSPEVKALAIATALEVGVSHNRWAVMDTAALLINSINGNEEAIAVRRELEKAPGRLVDIEERLEAKKLHVIIRELLTTAKKARAASEL